MSVEMSRLSFAIAQFLRSVFPGSENKESAAIDGWIQISYNVGLMVCPCAQKATFDGFRYLITWTRVHGDARNKHFDQQNVFRPIGDRKIKGSRTNRQ